MYEEEEEQHILEELHKKEKDISILNKKELSADEMDELFCDA